MGGFIGIVFFIVIGIFLSKLDNKLGKTRYWNLYLVGLIGSILASFLVVYIIKLLGLYPFDPKALVIIFAIPELFGGVLLFSMLMLLIKGACVDKKTMKVYVAIFSVVFIAYFIFKIYYINYYYTHIRYFFELADKFMVYGQILYLLKLAIYLPLLYSLFLLAKKLGNNGVMAFIWSFLLTPIYIIILAFSKKLDNYTPCDKKLDNQQNTEQKQTSKQEL